MKTLLTTCLLVAALTIVPRAADPEIVGTWFGSIDTDRGQMEIGLTVTAEKEKLTGVLKTGHGDWAVTSITQKDGQWIVAFKGGDNEGQMIGRIKDTKFAGDWKSKMANGKFEVERSKKK
jgi:hypothetical protein